MYAGSSYEHSGANAAPYDITEIYRRRVGLVYRVCFSYMKNKPDSEDCVSDVFMRLLKSRPQFRDDEHEKAWLIRTAANVCKTRLTHRSRNGMDIDDESVQAMFAERQEYAETVKEEHREVMEAVQSLPEDYKTAVYLYYYEGYNSAEIGKMLGKAESTVRNHLRQARELLRELLGGEI